MNHAAPLPTVDWYLDRARDRAGIDSDRKLSLALGMAGVSVHYWRSRKTWPDENHMIRLCELAQVPVDQGLLDLARWRAKGKSADVWRALRAALVASVLGLVLAAQPAQNQALASTTVEIIGGYSVYYG